MDDRGSNVTDSSGEIELLSVGNDNWRLKFRNSIIIDVDLGVIYFTQNIFSLQK